VSTPASPVVLSPPTVAFPQPGELARKFFWEAIRHLGDARVLHQGKRYPGAITSSMKAAELGIKAALIVDGCLGWWEKLQQTHKPLDEIRSHGVLKFHYQALHQHDPLLITAVAALEKLVPSRPDIQKFSAETEANTEYPFFYLEQSTPGAPTISHLVGPSEYFTATASRDSYRTAHELLTAYQALYPQIKAWKHRLPRPL
jgi:hypothetical protein